MGSAAKVVIVGGGFGGIETALELRKHATNLSVTLINHDECFSFTPALYETAAGELTEADVCLIIPTLFTGKDIRYFSDEAERIDTKKQLLQTKNRLTIPYDYLVIALGAQTQTYDIPGLRKYCYNLKTKDEAQQIYSKVTTVLDSGECHHFVVCGGGLTGVEFVTTLADHICTVADVECLSQTPIRISLIHSRTKVLHDLPEEIASFATNFLTRQGIAFYGQSRVQKVTQKFIRTNNELLRRLPYDTAIWCGGLKTHEFIIDNNLPYRNKEMGRGMPGGGMKVTPYLHLPGNRSVFGVGDCVDIQHTPSVKTAQNAIHQAHLCARNILHDLCGEPLEAYKQVENVFYVALGKHTGIRLDGQGWHIGKKERREKDRLEKAYIEAKATGKEAYSCRYIYTGGV